MAKYMKPAVTNSLTLCDKENHKIAVAFLTPIMNRIAEIEKEVKARYTNG